MPPLLDSILAQTCRDLEVIVVDDCSDERCDKTIAAYQANGLNVRLIRNTTRQYTKNCRLIGFRAAMGRIIGFADADDVLWGTEALEKHVRMILDADADMLHFAAMQTVPGSEPVLLKRALPMAETLRDGDIFAAYVNAKMLPTTIWNKLCSRRLWERILPLAEKGEGILYSEDVFLASLLFFHARSYVGSETPGYHYFYYDRKPLKRHNRIGTLSYILRELVPYFHAQSGNSKAAAGYEAQVREDLLAELSRHLAVGRHRMGQITTAYACGDVPPQSVQVIYPDTFRKLLGLCFLARTDSIDCAFIVDGAARQPAFHRTFPFPSLNPEMAFCHIVWLPYDDDFATLEVRRGGTPLTIMCENSTASRLTAADLFPAPPRPHRQFLHNIVALLAKLPFIRDKFKDCWLLADRDFAADDNAEHFYRWLRQNHPERNIVFALGKQSPDWERLEREGFNLVDITSLWYCFAWIHCSWLISSQTTNYIRKVNWTRRYSDLASHQFCFLQHGIIKDAMLGLNRIKMDIFITSTLREYESIATDPRFAYTFSPREVRLTGLPRHDSLRNKADRVARPATICIMPTWRKKLAGNLPTDSGQFPYNPEFRESDYFRNWQAVLNSDALSAAAKRHNCRILFFPHPCIVQQLADFDLTRVTLATESDGIQDVLADTALLITDYSSIAMEIALLRRAVLYFQFDRGTFFAEHSYTRGYFDYDRDGFGDVALTVTDLVEKSVALLDSGCAVNGVYADRADAFFTFNDQNNCQRVYDAICDSSVPCTRPLSE